MALVLADRVQETTTTTGTGSYTLAGAVTGFQSFAVVGNSNTTYYTATNSNDYEIGIGTYTASGTILSRNTVLASSNAGNAVNWGVGSKNIFITYPAGRSVFTDGASIGTGVATFLGTPSSANLAAVVTDETGSGSLVFATSPTLVTPVLGTPTSGTLSNCTVDGTDSVGFRNIPVNSQSAAYTLVLADGGKTILHPIADNNARTFTIPANASVAYSIGTAITFVNLINTVTIAITTDTMYLAGPGTTGSRTLAAYGMATAVKAASTSWIISGNGLT